MTHENQIPLSKSDANAIRKYYSDTYKDFKNDVRRLTGTIRAGIRHTKAALNMFHGISEAISQPDSPIARMSMSLGDILKIIRPADYEKLEEKKLFSKLVAAGMLELSGLTNQIEPYLPLGEHVSTHEMSHEGISVMSTTIRLTTEGIKAHPGLLKEVLAYEANISEAQRNYSEKREELQNEFWSGEIEHEEFERRHDALASEIDPSIMRGDIDIMYSLNDLLKAAGIQTKGEGRLGR